MLRCLRARYERLLDCVSGGLIRRKEEAKRKNLCSCCATSDSALLPGLRARTVRALGPEFRGLSSVRQELEAKKEEDLIREMFDLMDVRCIGELDGSGVLQKLLWLGCKVSGRWHMSSVNANVPELCAILI